MAYCGPRGIPLSVFLGRVVRPGVDSEWTPGDRAAALDWAAYEGQRCQGCGTHPDEWETPASFHAHPVKCRGCQGQQRLSEALQNSQERGVFATTRPGSAMDCPVCRPDDD